MLSSMWEVPPTKLLMSGRFYLHIMFEQMESFEAGLGIKFNAVVLRYLTFEALKIPHTCCDHPYQRMETDSDSASDLSELEDEYKHELAFLEELMHEFEGELVTILQDPGRGIAGVDDFWNHTWKDRIARVWQDRFEGGDLPDDEKQRAEEIGVVWDQPETESCEVASNPHNEETLDYWLYELEQIEPDSV
jgi:hypothetical protein